MTSFQRIRSGQKEVRGDNRRTGGGKARNILENHIASPRIRSLDHLRDYRGAAGKSCMKFEVAMVSYKNRYL